MYRYILKSCCYTFVQYIKEALVPPSKAFKTLLIPSYNTFVRRCQYPLTIYIQDIDTSVKSIMETFWIPPCNTFGIICWYICISLQYFRESLIPLYRKTLLKLLYNTFRRHCLYLNTIHSGDIVYTSVQYIQETIFKTLIPKYNTRTCWYLHTINSRRRWDLHTIFKALLMPSYNTFRTRW